MYASRYECENVVCSVFYSMDGDSFTSLITVPFHTAKEAEIAWNTLRVDREPPRGGCTKAMHVEGKACHRWKIHLVVVS